MHVKEFMDMNKKKFIKILVEAAVIILAGVILYNQFKDSFSDIVKQLAKTNILLLIVILVLGNMYYVIDSLMYSYLFSKEGYRISFPRCLAVGYMCIFFNVTTFGAGIKPAQVMYLHKKGVDVGKGLSITTMPYVFHKTIIAVYAVIMLLFNNMFVMRNFASTFMYIYIGAVLNITIVVAIILICASEKFHGTLYRIIDRIFKKEKYAGIKNKIKGQADNLRMGTKDIIKSKTAWIGFSISNIIKMSCWYVIPVIAIYACGGNIGSVTIPEAITVTALMQLIMGVIPTSGGVGSLEVVFSLLFAAVFGDVMAGSCMVLYRIATYYFPFVISAIIMIAVGKDMKKTEYKSV